MSIKEIPFEGIKNFWKGVSNLCDFLGIVKNNDRKLNILDIKKCLVNHFSKLGRLYVCFMKDYNTIDYNFFDIQKIKALKSIVVSKNVYVPEELKHLFR